ncbi:MAG: Ser-Thr-rich GPI-anchored membrane family protein, partial [Candidatus Krumholzibacteriia bacterium]
MAQTHSISGKIVIEGRGKYGGVVVWVDSIHAAETDSLGDYCVAGFDDGSYAVMAWLEHCLARLVDSVQVSGNDVTGVNDTLFAGDVVEDGRINLLDAGKILLQLHATPGSASWDESLDLDCSGVIDSLDIAALMRHWKETAGVPSPSRIEVTEPTGATFWTLGRQDVSISWQYGETQGTISIVLYRGASPVDTIADAAPNSGSFSGYDVPVDLMPGTNYRVAVRFSGTNYGYSDYFEIKAAIFVTMPDSSTVWRPGQQDVPIRWTTGSLAGSVEINIYKGWSFIEQIEYGTSNDGVYAGDLPESLVSGEDYRIQVLHIDSRVAGYSDYFEIKQVLIVTEPTSSTIWNRGQKSVPVTWITGNFGGNVTINLYKGIGQVYQWIDREGTSNDGTELVDVPARIPPGSDYRVQVYRDADRNDFSDYFTIQESSIAITAPDTNTVWLRGQGNVAIRWESSFMTGSVSIGLYQGGSLVETIVSSTPNDGEYSEYSIPLGLTIGADYQVRIDSDEGKQALSAHFEIAKPSEWSWLYPSTQGYNLRSVSFTDANTGTAVGEYGAILRTTDGGATWIKQWGSTRKTLYGVAFLDANTGLAVGDGGVILKTTDGGATWVGKASGLQRGALYSVAFADADTVVAVGYGWAVGSTIGAVAFCRSTDGGETWISSVTYGYIFPKSVSFFDAKIGAAAADCGWVYWTNDGGATWNTRGGVWGGDIEDAAKGISVLDANTAVLVGWDYYAGFDGYTYQGVIYRTTDAGATWSNVRSGDRLNAVSFADNSTGVAVGESWRYRTTDGGATWVLQTGGIGSSLAGVSFGDATAGTAVGAYGRIIRTTDAGAAWTLQPPSTAHTLRGISFTGGDTGLVVGGSGSAGIVLRTTDEGATWSSQATSGGALNDISMANADTGTAVGGYGITDMLGHTQLYGVILRTTDGGVTWGSRSVSDTIYKGVAFADPNTGIAFGSVPSGEYSFGRVILRTQNGGATWVPLPIGYDFNDAWFSDANVGTAVGDSGAIYRTIDGGATWIPQTSGTTNGLNSVHFIDANTGTVVGYGGTILRTVDGGATWTQQTSGTARGLNGVRFADANTGVAVGIDGTILRTTDGGVMWVR